MPETFELTHECTVILARYPDGWWRMLVKDNFVGERTLNAVSHQQMEAFAKWLYAQVAQQPAAPDGND